MKKILSALLGVCFILAMTTCVWSADTVLFSFEGDSQGWEIPDWALEKSDHVADSLDLSEKYANEGKTSLEIMVDFPGAKWTGAYIEVVEYMDWSPYSKIAADVYLPPGGPMGLKSKMIITVGESWKWVEMSKTTVLEPGKWVTVVADLKPGSKSWRTSKITDAFRGDVRKFGLRVDSNMKPAYTGKIYVDNIRLIE